MTITFLGLGAMGAALARATVDAGHDVAVWNRDPRRAAPFGGNIDVRTTDGPIVVCLFDHASVHAVLDGTAAALAGRTVVNLTTTTPDEARELAGWAAAHDITYLDGAIMAVPEMIGRPGAAILYSGDATAFATHRELLALWGASDFFGTDAGLASLHDMAMLSGMYTMLAGFLHGAAMVAAAGVPAQEFAARQVPFLAAMAGQLAGYAATADARDYLAPGLQSLEFTGTALAALRRASIGAGVPDDVLRPVHDLVAGQIAAGFGGHGTARVFESLRPAGRAESPRESGVEQLTTG
jgi:3-hydroxyisobutyrate dehydrogenase-like beta-hydroxyacid dehydrogenase